MKPYLIGIAGPSCAGKSELAKHLARALPATRVGLDGYYRELRHLALTERARFNFDEPSALDRELLVAQIGALASGVAIDQPVYDFATHSRTGQTERIVPGEFVIVEGLFALYWPELRALYGTTVYVEAPDEVCLERRQVRDVRERARTAESVLCQFRETVQPMAELHVRPTRQFAKVVVSGLDVITRSAQAVLQHIPYDGRAGALTRSRSRSNSPV